MSDWWYMAAEIPQQARDRIACWVLEQELLTGSPGIVLKKPSTYHVTLIYSYDGRGREDLPHRIASAKPEWQWFARATGVEAFTPAIEHALVPVVLALDSPNLKAHAERHIAEFKRAGYRVSEFEGGYKPHITVALVDPNYAPKERAANMTAPDFPFKLGWSTVTGGYRG